MIFFSCLLSITLVSTSSEVSDPLEVDVDVDVRCPVLVPFLPRSPSKGTLWGAVKAWGQLLRAPDTLHAAY